jgi:hypothetical protein
MSLEVYYPQDILNALLAAEEASNQALTATGGRDKFAQGYEAGYRAALNTRALAFGLIRFDGSYEGQDWQPTLVSAAFRPSGKNAQER